jgi:hypothetical protein
MSKVVVAALVALALAGCGGSKTAEACRPTPPGSGHRSDADAPPLRADIPGDYGPTGFQATGVTFASAGCWDITGRVGDEHLTFTVLVTRG